MKQALISLAAIICLLATANHVSAQLIYYNFTQCNTEQ